MFAGARADRVYHVCCTFASVLICTTAGELGIPVLVPPGVKEKAPRNSEELIELDWPLVPPSFPAVLSWFKMVYWVSSDI